MPLPEQYQTPGRNENDEFVRVSIPGVTDVPLGIRFPVNDTAGGFHPRRTVAIVEKNENGDIIKIIARGKLLGELGFKPGEFRMGLFREKPHNLTGKPDDDDVKRINKKNRGFFLD